MMTGAELSTHTKSRKCWKIQDWIPETQLSLRWCKIQRSNVIFKNSYGGPIDFDTFVDIISERLGNNKSRNGAEKLFAIYDPEGTGYILIKIIRFIDFPKLKAVAKELGETLNDEELKEMIHHIHIIRKTDEPD